MLGIFFNQYIYGNARYRISFLASRMRSSSSLMRVWQRNDAEAARFHGGCCSASMKSDFFEHGIGDGAGWADRADGHVVQSREEVSVYKSRRRKKKGRKKEEEKEIDGNG